MYIFIGLGFSIFELFVVRLADGGKTILQLGLLQDGNISLAEFLRRDRSQELSSK